MKICGWTRYTSYKTTSLSQVTSIPDRLLLWGGRGQIQMVENIKSAFPLGTTDTMMWSAPHQGVHSALCQKWSLSTWGSILKLPKKLNTQIIQLPIPNSKFYTFRGQKPSDFDSKYSLAWGLQQNGSIIVFEGYDRGKIIWKVSSSVNHCMVKIWAVLFSGEPKCSGLAACPSQYSIQIVWTIFESSFSRLLENPKVTRCFPRLI